MNNGNCEKFEPEIHKKGWGYEKWIRNSSEYCGKILFFNAGKKCSWHYHKIKDEVFYVQRGLVVIKFSWENELTNASEILLRAGESFHVPQGLRHQMKAIEETELFEISTTHFDTDSIRIVKGD